MGAAGLLTTLRTDARAVAQRAGWREKAHSIRVGAHPSPALKTAEGGDVLRGFESPSLRLSAS